MTGRPDSFMPFYIGDYLADTSHLSAAEHGAYMLLIMHYWRTGVPLLDDEVVLARIARMSKPEWKASRATVRAFFEEAVIDGDHVLTHTRIEKELLKAGETYAKRKEASDAAVAAKRAKRDVERLAQLNAGPIAPPIVEPIVVPLVNQPQPQPQPQSSNEDVPLAKANGVVADAGQGDSASKPAWWPKRDRYGRVLGDVTDKLLFDVGKAVLGKSSGGQITKLRKCYRHDLRTVMDILLQADDRSDAGSWFAGVLRRAELDERLIPQHEKFPEEIYADV